MASQDFESDHKKDYRENIDLFSDKYTWMKHSLICFFTAYVMLHDNIRIHFFHSDVWVAGTGTKFRICNVVILSLVDVLTCISKETDIPYAQLWQDGSILVDGTDPIIISDFSYWTGNGTSFISVIRKCCNNKSNSNDNNRINRYLTHDIGFLLVNHNATFSYLTQEITDQILANETSDRYNHYLRNYADPFPHQNILCDHFIASCVDPVIIIHDQTNDDHNDNDDIKNNNNIVKYNIIPPDRVGYQIVTMTKKEILNLKPNDFIYLRDERLAYKFQDAIVVSNDHDPQNGQIRLRFIHDGIIFKDDCDDIHVAVNEEHGNINGITSELKQEVVFFHRLLHKRRLYFGKMVYVSHDSHHQDHHDQLQSTQIKASTSSISNLKEKVVDNVHQSVDLAKNFVNYVQSLSLVKYRSIFSPNCLDLLTMFVVFDDCVCVCHGASQDLG